MDGDRGDLAEFRKKRNTDYDSPITCVRKITMLACICSMSIHGVQKQSLAVNILYSEKDSVYVIN